MNIGIDIDNVISNFNEALLNEYINHDKDVKDKGIINPNASYIRNGMFDWSIDEELSFYHNNVERIATNLELINDCKTYIDKLIKCGNKIYIITGRDNGEYINPYEMTKKWLDKNKINYDELILTNAYNHHEKADICIEKHIDIMIDDSIHVCEECSNKNINILLFGTIYNKNEKRFKRANSWKEAYEYICGYKKERINVILDTDTYNECDDQFALAYMLKSQNIFNVEAITIAPYSHNTTRKVTVKDGQENSYNEVLKICNWLNFDTSNKVFKGSTDYIQNGYNESNEAVNKIIEISLKNEKTYIMAIGAITNVALAIKNQPSIINKIEIIWLGGNELGYKDNLEYNFKQDINAVKIIFESNVKLTIIPCKNVSSELLIDINTLKSNLNENNTLCNYLINRFYNDGYHGIQESRVIWDIVVIAYMINSKWFDSKQISCPKINADTSYAMTTNNHMVTFITKIKSNEIYENMFKRLNDK